MNTAAIQRNEITAYQQPIDEVLAALGTDALRGLSEAEARARLEHYGRNELTAEKPIPRWRKFLAQFQDVLVILLLIATVISAGLWLYRARIGAALRSDSDLRRRAAQRGHGLHSGVARGIGGRGVAQDVGERKRR